MEHNNLQWVDCIQSAKLTIVLGLFFAIASPVLSNEPCSAILYDFNGTNVASCGPDISITDPLTINGAGITAFSLSEACGSPGDGGSPTDVQWATFVVPEGGSFEWQTLLDGNKYFWELYISTDPVGAGDENTQSGCSNLLYLDCGQEFSGWRTQYTLNPNLKWRFYVAFFLRDGETTGNASLKIRKACGLSCLGSTISVTASDDVCINSGSTNLSATAMGGGGGPYSYFWTPADGLSNPAVQNPVATPAATTTYTVTAVGADNCPAADEVTVSFGFCCEALAGTISNDANPADLFIPCNKKELNAAGGGQASFTATTPGTETVGLQYALLLIDENGAIVDFTAGTTIDQSGNAVFSGSFTFVGQVPGMYTVYGLSYDQNLNTPADVSTYLTSNIIGLGLSNDVIQIQNDDSDNGGSLCLDLVSGGSANKVTIGEADCGSFVSPQ